MPNYFPATSGVWSNLTNWLTAVGQPAGRLPNELDDVYANEKVIYIDGNYSVSSIRNISAVDITKGGYFVANDGISLSAYVYGGGVSQVACLQFLSAAPASATLIGSLCAGDPNARVLRPIAFRNTSSGTFNIIGGSDGILNNGSNADPYNNFSGLIINDSTGILNITGIFYGAINTFGVATILNRGTVFFTGSGFAGSGGNDSSVVWNAAGNLYVNGLIRAGGPGRCMGITNFDKVFFNGTVIGGSSNQSYGIVGGVIELSGTVIGGSAIAEGINSTNASITGTVIGGALGSGLVLAGSSGSVTVIGTVIGGTGTDATGASNTSSSGTLRIIGDAVGGSGNRAHGVSNTSTGFTFVTKAVGNNWGRGSGSDSPVVGGAAVGANNSNILGALYLEELQSGLRGQFPTAGLIYLIKKETNQATMFGILSSLRDYPFSSISGDPNYNTALSGITGFNFLLNALSGGGTLSPIVSNVRFNTVYNFGTSKGTLRMPIPQSVLLGYGVDNTQGTAIADPSLVWVAPISAFENKPLTLGGRIINSLTIESSGELATEYN